MPKPKRLGPWKAAALTVAVLLVTPSYLYSFLGRGILACSAPLVRTMAPPRPADPVRQAVLNVTTDFDELTQLLSDFWRTQPGESREQFERFLAERATRSYPRLEGLLDWLLSIYKFAFPFLIISMVARLSGGNGGEAGEGFASAGSGGWEPAAPRAGRLAPQQAWAGAVRALPNAAAAAEGAPAGAGVGGEGGSEEDLGEGSPVASLGRRASGYGELLDEGKPARLPSRVLPRTVSGGQDRGTPAPSTPLTEAPSRLPLHPAQLQGMRQQRQLYEVHSLVHRS